MSFRVFMALGIYQVTYSDRKFCRSFGLSVFDFDFIKQETIYINLIQRRQGGNSFCLL